MGKSDAGDGLFGRWSGDDDVADDLKLKKSESSRAFNDAGV